MRRTQNTYPFQTLFSHQDFTEFHVYVWRWRGGQGDGNNLHSRFWMWYETLAEAQIMTWVLMDFALIVIFSSEIHIPILALLSHYFHTICLQWSPFKSRWTMYLSKQQHYCCCCWDSLEKSPIPTLTYFHTMFVCLFVCYLSWASLVHNRCWVSSWSHPSQVHYFHRVSWK